MVGEMKKAKKLKEWIFQKSVLKKLLISYILLLILLIASNLFIYTKTRSLLMTKEITYNRMALDYTREIMDQNIQGIYDSCVTLLRDRETQKRLGEIESVGNQMYIINQLLEFTQKNSLIEHAILFDSEIDYVLYEEGSLEAANVFETHFQYEDWKKENLLEKFEQAEIGYIPRSNIKINSTSGNAEGSYITIYFASPYFSRDSRLLLLLPENRMRELFKNAYSSNQFMILAESGEPIVKPENGMYQKDFIDMLKAAKKSESGHFRYGDYLVIQEKSQVFNWEYTVLINYSDIFQDVNIVRSILMYLTLAVSLLGIVVIVISIRDNYMPLKEILNYIEKGPREKTENEYDEIKHEILNLKENNHTYKENLTLYELIQHGTDEKSLQEFFAEPYVCSIIIAGTEMDEAEEIQDFLEKSYLKSCCGVRLIKSNPNELYIILNSKDLRRDDIIKALEKFWEEKSPQLFASVGSVETVQNLKRSCDYAKRTIKNGTVKYRGCVYTNVDNKGDCIYFPLDFENRMMSYIYASDRESVNKFIEEILDNNSAIVWSSFGKLFLDFYENYRHLALKLKIAVNEDIWKEISVIRYNLEQIRTFLKSMYQEIVFESPVDKRAKYVGEFVKDYIKEHYMDSGITIEEIAGKLDLASTYVSTLFKKEAQISFSQYLSDFRIQKAQELLEQTEMKVKDIAMETGFGTYNNFARVFKKKLGMTPVEYKNQIS